MLKLALTPRWILGLLCALAVATGFMLLSHWQLASSTSGQTHADPAKEKVVPLESQLLGAQKMPTTAVDTMVRTTGHYEPADVVLVANRLNGTTHGYWVLERFVPDAQPPETTGPGQQPYSLGVARGFTTDPDPEHVPAPPKGRVTVVGRLVPDEAPVVSREVDSAQHVGSPATAQLVNLWQSPMTDGFLTASAEVPAGQQPPLEHNGRLRAGAGLLPSSQGLEKISTRQATDESVNWLNVFYALEWVVFAGFAVFLWWRLLADAHRRLRSPELYYEMQAVGEAEYFYEESTGRFFYYDAERDEYYYFDDQQDAGAAASSSR